MWFITGFEHIASWQGYDHILFLIALCANYAPEHWKRLLILITAFTIGHSITLALSVFNMVQLSSPIVEFLIPLTIVLSCINNLTHIKRDITGNINFNYGLVLLFGCIHGLGFSTLLKSLLGNKESVLSPLFAFNIGLETGQLVILMCILIISVALSTIFGMKRNTLNLVISIAVLIISLILVINRFIELI